MKDEKDMSAQEKAFNQMWPGYTCAENLFKDFPHLRYAAEFASLDDDEEDASEKELSPEFLAAHPECAPDYFPEDLFDPIDEPDEEWLEAKRQEEEAYQKEQEEEKKRKPWELPADLYLDPMEKEYDEGLFKKAYEELVLGKVS